MNLAYIRVSSSDQKPDRQISQLEGKKIEKTFTDVFSGKSMDRPELKKLMEFCREGDQLFVCSIDRLARSLPNLFKLLEHFKTKGVTVNFLKENICLPPKPGCDPMTNFAVSLFGMLAELERDMIRDRQRQGIAIAKKKGVYRGRKPIDPQIIDKAMEKVALGVPLARVAREFKIGLTTLKNYKKARQQEAKS